MKIPKKKYLKSLFPIYIYIYIYKTIKRTKHNMHNQIQVRSLKKYSAEIFTNALKTVPFSYCNIFSNVNVA